MAQSPKTTVQMVFADGNAITSWESVTLKDNYLSPLPEMQFTARPKAKDLTTYRQKLQKGSRVTIKINGNQQGAMYIQTVSRSTSRSGVSFDVSCAPALFAAYEGHVDPSTALRFTSATSIKTAIDSALEPYGISVIEIGEVESVSAMMGAPVKGFAPPIKLAELKKNQIQAKHGQSAYSYCANIVNRLGVVIRPAWTGDLLLSRPEYDQKTSYAIIEGRDAVAPTSSWITALSVEDTDTNEGQFSNMIVTGQKVHRPKGRRNDSPQVDLSASNANFIDLYLNGDQRAKGMAEVIEEQVKTTSIKTMVRKKYYPARPSYICVDQPFKPFFRKDKFAADVLQAENVALLMLGLQAKDAYVVTATLPQWTTNDGKIFTVNTVATVVSKSLGINEKMWVLERTLSLTKSGGMMAEVKLVPLGTVLVGQVPS